MEIKNFIPLWTICQIGFVVSSLEMPKYKVLQKYKNFEERAYNTTKWISTTDEDPLNIKGMYLRLFYYMQGANAEGRTIEMTAPMLRHCRDDGNVTMMLFLPASIHNLPPMPTDNAVNITELPAKNYLVRRFGGFANEAIWLEELDELRVNARSAHVDANVSAEGEIDYYAASYSGFHDIVDRRNEIWLSE